MNLRLAPVEYSCAPVVVLTLVGVGILIAVIAVKFVKTGSIFRKMCGYPVEDNTYSVSMAVVDKFHKV